MVGSTLKPELRQSPRVEQALKLIGGMKFSNFMELSESEFRKFVEEIEKDPLFKKLFSPSEAANKIVSYHKFPGTDLSRRFYELREVTISGGDFFDLESFLSQKRYMVGLIKRLGAERFKEYFLYNNSEISLAEVAEKCRLSLEEAKQISAFLDEISIHNEFYFPSVLSSTPRMRYSKIASIEKSSGHSDFIIGWFSPDFARGRYFIDYHKLDQRKKEGLFSQEEIRKIDKLIRNLELISHRKNTLYQIIRHISGAQRDYLESGDPKDLKPLSQKELATRMGVNPSLICRAIKYKSIETPTGQEKPLEFFLPSRKRVRKELVREILQREKEALSDREIRNKLKEEFNISISRRTINDYRRELEQKTPQEAREFD